MVWHWQEAEMALHMHGLVSPKLHELLGDKFVSFISNNSDFDISDIIEKQKSDWFDGPIDL